MGLELVKKIINKEIKEIKNSEEYVSGNSRKEVLELAVNYLEGVKEMLVIDPNNIRETVYKSISKHTDKEVSLDVWFHYDSIYPNVSITSQELEIEELIKLAREVTNDVYEDVFPIVVIA